MSREDNARAAVQALIPDDEILDVVSTVRGAIWKAKPVLDRTIDEHVA